jgi:hypothetical protein
MIVRKGTTVYPSVIGQYNFHYPNTNDPFILTMNIEVEKLPWKSTSKKVPVTISSPENYLQYKVLWIELPV